MATLNRKQFTSSGSWLVPEGVTTVIIFGAGGGGGGSGGMPVAAGMGVGTGGGGALQQSDVVNVTPGDTLTITLGGGGAGGAPAAIGADGSPTTVVNGMSTSLFSALGAGAGLGVNGPGSNSAGIPNIYPLPGFGGYPQALNAFAPGSAGSDDTIAPGGTGGGAGPRGPGGNGGNGHNTISGGNGSTAPANSAAGGGGGGDTDSGPNGGSGGAGGSGYLDIVW